MFALYNLDGAFNASPATYRDEMLVLNVFLLISGDAKNTAAGENSFKKKKSPLLLPWTSIIVLRVSAFHGG